MFTGLIEEIGKIERIVSLNGGLQFTVHADLVLSDLKIGDSISIDGACLTVVSKSKTTFDVEAVEETLKKTTLGHLKVGDMVNLERSVQVGERLGGHFVQGHIDGIGEVVGTEERLSSWIYTVRIPEEFCRYTVPAGSIAINGVSLTIAEVDGCEISISIIPHTYQQTTFKQLKTGDKVNLEFDLIGKYVERLIGPNLTQQLRRSKITGEWLKELGY